MHSKLLLAGGVINLVIAVFHMTFWKMFDWPASLALMSHQNQVVPQILNIHLTLVFIAFGYLSIYYRQDLVYSKIGRALMWIIAAFYLIRAVNEVLFWDISQSESMVKLILCLTISAVYTFPLLTTHGKVLAEG